MPGQADVEQDEVGPQAVDEASASSPEVTSASASNPGVALITARAASRNSGLVVDREHAAPACAGHACQRRRGAGNGADRRQRQACAPPPGRAHAELAARPHR